MIFHRVIGSSVLVYICSVIFHFLIIQVYLELILLHYSLLKIKNLRCGKITKELGAYCLLAFVHTLAPARKISSSPQS